MAAVGLLVSHLDVMPGVAVGIVLLAAIGAVVVAVRDQGSGAGLFRYVMALAVVSVILILVSAHTLTS